MKTMIKNSEFVYEEENGESLAHDKNSGATHILNHTATLLLKACEQATMEQALQNYVNHFDLENADETIIRNDAKSQIAFFVNSGILLENPGSDML